MDSAFICSRVCGGEAERTAFDGFEILANPLGGTSTADRARRSFPGRDGGPGVTYASHSISLAKREGARPHDRDLFILMENGGGRSVLRFPMIGDGGAAREALLSQPEPVLYALLYAIWQTADNARGDSASETAHKWAMAYNDGRIRKRRRSGQVSLYVETEFEKELRTGKAKPSRVSINAATGEVQPA